MGIKLKISNHKKTDNPDSIVLAPTTLTNFFLNNLTGLHLFCKSVSVIDDTDGYHQLIPIGVLGKAYQWVSTDDTTKILGVRQHYYWRRFICFLTHFTYDHDYYTLIHLTV